MQKGATTETAVVQHGATVWGLQRSISPIHAPAMRTTQPRDARRAAEAKRRVRQAAEAEQRRQQETAVIRIQGRFRVMIAMRILGRLRLARIKSADDVRTERMKQWLANQQASRQSGYVSRLARTPSVATTIAQLKRANTETAAFRIQTPMSTPPRNVERFQTWIDEQQRLRQPGYVANPWTAEEKESDSFRCSSISRVALSLPNSPNTTMRSRTHAKFRWKSTSTASRQRVLSAEVDSSASDRVPMVRPTPQTGAEQASAERCGAERTEAGRCSVDAKFPLEQSSTLPASRRPPPLTQGFGSLVRRVSGEAVESLVESMLRKWRPSGECCGEGGSGGGAVSGGERNGENIKPETASSEPGLTSPSVVPRLETTLRRIRRVSGEALESVCLSLSSSSPRSASASAASSRHLGGDRVPLATPTTSARDGVSIDPPTVAFMSPWGACTAPPLAPPVIKHSPRTSMAERLRRFSKDVFSA